MKNKTFYAIKPDNKTLTQYQEYQKQNSHLNQILKWTAPADLHLTLYPPRILDNYKLETELKILNNFSVPATFIQTKKTAFGPSLEKPTLLWTLTYENEMLIKWSTELTRILNLPKTQMPFLPHLTLGRLRGQIDNLPHINPFQTVFKVNSLYVLETIPVELRGKESEIKYRNIQRFDISAE